MPRPLDPATRPSPELREKSGRHAVEDLIFPAIRGVGGME
jgi:hypothetical protein